MFAQTFFIFSSLSLIRIPYLTFHISFTVPQVDLYLINLPEDLLSIGIEIVVQGRHVPLVIRFVHDHLLLDVGKIGIDLGDAYLEVCP